MKPGPWRPQLALLTERRARFVVVAPRRRAPCAQWEFYTVHFDPFQLLVKEKGSDQLHSDYKMNPRLKALEDIQATTSSWGDGGSGSTRGGELGRSRSNSNSPWGGVLMTE